MGGCLGPKQRKQQVYMEVIEAIHQQITHMTFLQNENLDIYESIKEKLSKKGLLRKLIDNLISHRNKIYDSLNHNYQIVLQNTSIQSKYGGILIMDQIILGIYSRPKPAIAQSLQSSLGPLSPKQLSSLLSPHKRSLTNLNTPIIREIDGRFDLIYFNLVRYVMDKVPKMFLRTLKSIDNFVTRKDTRFVCMEQVIDIMNTLINKIKKQVYINQSAKTYSLLISNVKQNFKDYQKHQDLFLFIHIWMQQTNIHNINYSGKLQLSHQQSLEVLNQQQEFKKNIEKIIKCYFDINIQSGNSHFLYQIIFLIYVQNDFQFNKIQAFQTFMYQIVLKNDLKVHFFRGLLLKLLQYLVHLNDNKTLKATNDSITSKSVKENNESKRSKTIKQQNSISKVNTLCRIKTLRRWVSYCCIDLNETVCYNCPLLIQSFLSNLSLSDTSLTTQILCQFLKLIRSNITSLNKKTLILTLIEKIKSQETHQKIRSLVISLIREFLQDQAVMQSFGEDFGCLVTINQGFSKQNQLEIVQLAGFVVKALPKHLFNENTHPTASDIINFKHKMAQFIYSCYIALISEDKDQVFKYRFCCSLISFLKSIQLNRNRSYLLGFVLQLQKQLMLNIGYGLCTKKYFMIYLTYQICHILQSQRKMPLQLDLINQQISHMSPKSHQSLLFQQINKPKYSLLDIKQTFRIQELKQRLIRDKKINRANFQSIVKVFQCYFACQDQNKSIKDSRFMTQDTKEEDDKDKIAIYSSTKNPFGRKDSVYLDSDRQSFQQQNDDNLKNVLNILHR